MERWLQSAGEASLSLSVVSYGCLVETWRQGKNFPQKNGVFWLLFWIVCGVNKRRFWLLFWIVCWGVVLFVGFWEKITFVCCFGWFFGKSPREKGILVVLAYLLGCCLRLLFSFFTCFYRPPIKYKVFAVEVVINPLFCQRRHTRAFYMCLVVSTAVGFFTWAHYLNSLYYLYYLYYLSYLYLWMCLVVCFFCGGMGGDSTSWLITNIDP